MWRKQIRAERAAEKALKGRPGSSGNEGGPSEDASENEADNRTLVQSGELQHPLSIAEDIRSPGGSSQAEDTLHGSISDEDSSERSSISPDEAQADNTFSGRNVEDRSRNATPDPPYGSGNPSSDAEDSPLLGGS